MHVLQLTASESQHVWQLAGLVREDYAANENHTAIDRHVPDLPARLRQHLAELQARRTGVSLVRGLPVDRATVGPTPTDWTECRAFTRHDAVAALVAAGLGRLFGWDDEQDGRLVQNIVPVRAHETDQVSSGSAAPIWWHTEDAFQAAPPSVLTLFCLRNDEAAETTYCTLGDLRIAADDVEALRAPAFEFRNDLSHAAANTAIRRYAVLSGPADDLRIRLDPYFMQPVAHGRAAAAVRRLSEQIDRRLQAVALVPGDCLIVDNFRAVHGRRPFQAAYGPSGRWLKRTHVASTGPLR